MHQHALQTAMSLYESGTYSLEVAARQAGITETRLLDSIARHGLEAGEHTSESVRERHRVAAD